MDPVGEFETELDTLRFRLIVAAIFALVSLGGATDLYLDAPDRWLTAHVLFEIAIMFVSLAAAVFLARGWWRASTVLSATRGSLELRRAERDHWRANAERALEGLGKAINAQFDSWQLTPSEREVALLLLKGLGHKQVAARTGRSERTVRQHAVSVYQKSGLAGRAELAAFFLEGLMLPTADAATAPSV